MNKRVATLPILLLATGLACNFGRSAPPTVALPTEPAPPPPAPTAAKATESIPQPSQRTAVPEIPGRQQVADAPLSARGPWILAQSEGTLFAMNSDGSGLTQLFTLPPYFELGAASPAGGRVAMVSSSDASGNTGRLLQLLELPSGRVETVTALTIPSTEPGPDTEPMAPIYDITFVAGDSAWSPDGRLLAFIGAQDGPSADLYLYNLGSKSISRLTDGPSQAYNLSWSPDGKYILHMGVNSFGTGAGYSMAGAWAAAADGSSVLSIYQPRSGDEIVIGWTSRESFLVHSWSAMCGSFNLRTVDLQGKTTGSWFIDAFNNAAFDPSSGNAMVSIDRFVAGCNPDGQQGLFLVGARAAPRRVSDTDITWVEWNEQAGLFFARGETAIEAFTSAGNPVPVPPGADDLPAVDPSGRWWAWFSPTANALMVGPPSSDGLAIWPAASYSLRWGPAQETLFFSSDGYLFVAQAPDFVPLVVGEALSLKEAVISGGN